MPFDLACRTLVENQAVFISPSVPIDLYAGNDPGTPVCFDFSTRIRPKVLFLLEMADDTAITPLSAKAARSVLEHRRSSCGKSIVVRDPATGALYSWWIHDISQRSRWECTGAEIDCLRDMIQALVSDKSSKYEDHAFYIFSAAFQGARGFRGRKPLSTASRIGLAEIVLNSYKAMGGSSDCPISAVSELSPPFNAVSSFRTYWKAVLGFIGERMRADGIKSDIHCRFASRSGGYSSLARALADKTILDVASPALLATAGSLLGMLVCCHEPLTRNYHQSVGQVETLGDNEMAFLGTMADSTLQAFLAAEVKKTAWPDLFLSKPRLALAAQSLLVIDDRTMTTEDIRSVSRALADSLVAEKRGKNMCESVAAFVKGLGLWTSKSNITQDMVLEIGFLVATAWDSSLGRAVTDQSAVVTAARLFATLFPGEIWNMLQEDADAPEHLRPLPKNPVVLQLLFASAFDGLGLNLFPPAARSAFGVYARSPLASIIRLGGSIFRWHPGCPYGDEDPLDKEEYEEGEFLMVWTRCGHACRLENITSSDMCKTCQVCGTSHGIIGPPVAGLAPPALVPPGDE